MTTTKDKYRDLSLRLFERTRKKKLKWQVNENDNTVDVHIASQRLVLTRSMNDNFEPLIGLSIVNSNGEYLDGFTDEEIAGATPPVAGMQSYFEVLSSIYEMARRQANGADEALEKVIAQLELDEEDDIPF